MKEVADDIVESGGRAEAVRVDAMNENEVNAFVDSLIHKGESLDLSFCAVDYQVVQNVALVPQLLVHIRAALAAQRRSGGA